MYDSCIDLNINAGVLFSCRARSSSSKLWSSLLEGIVTIFNKCVKIYFGVDFYFTRDSGLWCDQKVNIGKTAVQIIFLLII